MILLGTSLDGPLAWGTVVGGMLILAGLVATVYRLVKGETLADRVVALDLLSMILTALLTLFALAVRETAYLDAALVLALVAFLATVAFARYIERRGPDIVPPRADGHAPRRSGGDHG